MVFMFARQGLGQCVKEEEKGKWSHLLTVSPSLFLKPKFSLFLVIMYEHLNFPLLPLAQAVLLVSPHFALMLFQLLWSWTD